MTTAGSVPVVESALAEAEATLAAAGVETPRVDAEWLLAGILDVRRAALALNARRPLVASAALRYDDAVQRRARREPLQRILGWEEFRGLRFALSADVLIPRPETEILVEWALSWLPKRSGAVRPRVIDVGTGSGCIACSLAHERRDAVVTAIDASPEAALVARRNAERLGVRVCVLVADLLTAVADASADLVVANLPYVPDMTIDRLALEVRAHEPRVALAGGSDGLDVIRRLIADAGRALSSGGGLVLETLGVDQARTVATLLEDAELVDVVTHDDLAGTTRFVGGRRP